MSQPLSQFCLLVSDFVSVSHPCLSLFHGGGIEKFARVARLDVLMNNYKDFEYERSFQGIQGQPRFLITLYIHLKLN